MSWLSNVRRLRLREIVGSGQEIPERLWYRCPSCGQMISHRQLQENLKVCSSCGHHMPLAADERLAMLFDEGTAQPIELSPPPTDPLRFRDVRRYADRLKEAQARTGRGEALIVAHGRLGGIPAVIAALDFAFMNGTLGVAVGAGLVTAARLAIVQEAPLIIVSASAGARLREGAPALMQMACTTAAISEVKEAGLPYIAVLADPTTGESAASFAMLGHIILAEPGAVIGFGGGESVRAGVPERPHRFRTAEPLAQHGLIDMVVHRHRLRETLVRIVALLRCPGPTAEVLPLPQAAAAAVADAAADGEGRAPE